MIRAVDSLGREVVLPRAPDRIVSLVPSITETLFELDLGRQIVGVTDYCVHPANEVRGKVHVGGTKNPRLGAIVALEPDLVIANREENRKRDVERLEALGVPVFVTYARDVETAASEIEAYGRLAGRASMAEGLATRIRAALESARAERATPPPRVVALVWKSPFMAVGSDTFADALIEACGGVNPFANREGRYPRIEERELETARPDVILLPTEPYAFEEADRLELMRLECPAAETGRIFVLEGELLTWYGPRTVRALETLSRLLRP